MDIKVYKYIELKEIHREAKVYVMKDTFAELNETIVEVGIGCSGEKHAMTLVTLFKCNNEVVHADFHYDMVLGKCNCSKYKKEVYQKANIGGFVLTSDLKKEKEND